MNRELTECCMENISFVYGESYYYDHLVCPECNTRWDITCRKDRFEGR